ncbi:hypothetical protein Slin15195_G024530 [Septoria linicola]|uniref:Uncharacterized protein n=1 Tax=Septoria linicola TaxID=215465 RepID=A0A9Q9AJN8_9PEZI|nr:hypothetical protein Slin14017_G023620 [Septoria linicola]USW49134.1 hypothetical protein Slin15195_G024530 [Septoria linicola]
MDSMQPLSTSLPRNRSEVPNDLLVDFKAAARSVTDLYRTAVTSQKQARQAGYQDALDDILAFLDKENMGLMDGEGWRVRQWATARLDGSGISTGPAATATDEEDEERSVKEEEKDDTRSSSPELQRRPLLPTTTSEITVEDDAPLQRRVVSEPPQAQPSVQPIPQQSNFTFQSSHAYPSGNHDRDMDMDGSTNSPVQTYTSTLTPSSTETVRIIPRSARSTRRSNHNRRAGSDNRTPTLNFNLGSGSGTKRKIPYPDFFDISGINDGGDRRDDNGRGGGGKRRHV